MEDHGVQNESIGWQAVLIPLFLHYQVERLFEEYELSFLVHASIENNLNISDHWFNQMGLTTSNLENTRLITK